MSEGDWRRAGQRHFAAALMLLSAAALPPSPARGDAIVRAETGFTRDRLGGFIYRLDRPEAGNGTLSVEWTDVHGRIVERQSIPVALRMTSDVPFSLDLRHAVAMRNEVRARLDLESRDRWGNPLRRHRQAVAQFVARPDDEPWRDYQILMWHPRTARQYAGLKALGISAGMVLADRANPGAELARPHVDAMLQTDLRWYVENIATDFYSPYHRWVAGRPVNWLLEESKRRYRADPTDPAAFIREPSLSDPAWLAAVARRLAAVVRAHRSYAPLYYSLADEPGIADLSTAWDFDLAAPSLAEMRRWLHQRYGNLDALNRQWGTRFARWDDVQPETTTAAMRRTDENYSAWADFKEWMDEAFARAIQRGTDAVRAADPTAIAAIEGTQMPGWGGYEYARLSPAVDLMEVYDYGGSVELIRGFNPASILLNTTSSGGAVEGHRLWRQWLRGGRGVVVWDEENAFIDADGVPGPIGRERSAQFRELRSGLGALFINGTARTDQIAVLYSPESMRARWMLDHRSKGAEWIARDAEVENEDNAHRTAVVGFLRLARRLALWPRMISTAQVEAGALRQQDLKMLVMPHVLALSTKAADEIRGFARREGFVVADMAPGDFDEHVRRREQSPLRDLFALPDSGGGRATLLDSIPEEVALARLKPLVARSGIRPAIAVLDDSGLPAAGMDTYLVQNGEASLVGLLREMAPVGGEPARKVRLVLPAKAHATDLRGGRALGSGDSVDITVQAAEPILLAFTPAAPAPPRLSAPALVRAGDIAAVAVDIQTAASTAVLRVEVIDPAGRIVAHYSGNWLVSGARAERWVPFALNDVPGNWQVRVTDTLGGQSTTASIALVAP